MKKLKRNELKNITGGERCFCLVSPDACYELNLNNEGKHYSFNCCTMRCELD
ncbi:hypothetical protein H5J24_03085 [Chryseobacterium capnotolerans]|uniref:hypothetical protein n=1 Tax=Chryseobacterium TaxID=59732 RepID=UPI000AFA6AED|nr:MULTISPECIES: hypothetical protein [Chryseobacterium]UHO39141.1 hypothetical protein H5J24_03085 [Chryseobacterium capnotolerans]